MKDRQKFQILEGFRKTSGQPMLQPATQTQGILTDTAETLPCLVREQVESSLAEALTASEQRLSALLHDRSRIGQELHDSVLQALYAIKLTIGQTPGLREGALQAAPCAHQAADQLHSLIQDIRRMILSVESDCVDPFRLVSELEALTQTVERVSQVRISLEIDRAAEEVLTGEEARELVTVSREAVSNCIRHSDATRIVIALRRIGPRVQLSINDNGSGFDIRQGMLKGLGFALMEERVRKIGGCLNIQSMVGQGTCITADVYLEPPLTTI